MTALAMQSKVTGTGEPLVLIGGGLTGWLSWDEHTARLNEHRNVIRLQLLSVQWASQDVLFPADYSVSTESRAIAAALDELGLREPIDLVGWSYGALAGLDFALDHPERIRTLTLIEPPAFWVLRELGPLSAEVQATVAFLETLRGDISEAQLEAFLETAGMRPPGGSVRDLPQWPTWSRHRQALLNNQAILRQQDDLARLDGFSRPVLVVKGDGSPAFHHDIADAIAEHLPRAQVAQFPAGHAPHIVSIDRFLEELSAFQGAVTSE